MDGLKQIWSGVLDMIPKSLIQVLSERTDGPALPTRMVHLYVSHAKIELLKGLQFDGAQSYTPFAHMVVFGVDPPVRAGRRRSN